jgi:hypothetical protein
MAKKARGSGAMPERHEDLEDRRRRDSEKAARIGQINRWCKQHVACVEAHDPTSGEWHHLPAGGCAEWVVKEANKYRKKGDVA